MKLITPALLLLFTPLAHAVTNAPSRFTVQVEGTAGSPDILLLPGLTSGRDVFAAEAAILAPANHLYRVQLNGFAGQPAGANATGPILAPVVEELHQYLVANNLHPYVIGHSLGGLLGLMLAQAHPEDVRKLLVVDALPFYALMFSPQATVSSVEPQGKMMQKAILGMSADRYAAQAAQTAAMLVNNPAGQKLVASESIASDRHVMANSAYEDLTTDLRPQLAGNKVTTVLLYPYDPALQGADPKVVDALYQGAYAGMPNLTLHRIDASRHFIMLDQPAAFDQQVQAFLH